MSELISMFFPVEGLLDQLGKLPSEIFSFGNYTPLAFIALGAAVVILAVGLIYGYLLISRGEKKLGVILLLFALLGAPTVWISLGGFMGSYVWPLQVIAIVLYLVCQCLIDYEQVGWNGMVGIGVVVFGALVIVLCTPNLNTDSEITNAIVATFAKIIPSGAIVSLAVGIVKDRIGEGTFISSNSDYSGTASAVTDLFDARDDLRNTINSASLSPSEKEALVKAHNEKYLDHISIKDGMYYNFSDE